MRFALTLFVLAAVAATPAMAQWVEQGDAGDLPATAQVPAGVNPLTSITGTFLASDADMYCIRIDNPQAFSATTCAVSTVDTQLWLFLPNGNGVSFNDDSPVPCGLQSTITGVFVSAPGTYLLAISKYDRDAMNGANAIWLDTPFNVERAPDGPGAPGPITGWAGTTTTGNYRINLAGTSYCGATAVEPTTWGNIKSVYR